MKITNRISSNIITRLLSVLLGGLLGSGPLYAQAALAKPPVQFFFVWEGRNAGYRSCAFQPGRGAEIHYANASLLAKVIVYELHLDTNIKTAELRLMNYFPPNRLKIDSAAVKPIKGELGTLEKGKNYRHFTWLDEYLMQASMNDKVRSLYPIRTSQKMELYVNGRLLTWFILVFDGEEQDKDCDMLYDHSGPGTK